MSDLKVSDVFESGIDFRLCERGFIYCRFNKITDDALEVVEDAVTSYDSNQELIAKQAERIEGQLKALGVAGKRIAQLESCKDVSDTLAKQRVELCKNKDAEINKLQAYNELLREALEKVVADSKFYFQCSNDKSTAKHGLNICHRVAYKALAATAKG